MADHHGDVRHVEQLRAWAHGALRELGVADAEDLVEQQNLGVDIGGDRKREAQQHATRVILHGNVARVGQAGEFEDALGFAAHIPRAEPEKRAREQNVLRRRQFDVEAGAEFQQRRHAASNGHLASRRSVDAEHQLEQRALPGAVAAEDADTLAVADPKRQVAIQPGVLATWSRPPGQRLEGNLTELPPGPVRPEAQRHALEGQRGRRHSRLRDER